MKLQAKAHIVDIPLTNTAKDTVQAMGRFKSAGCYTVVSLGGDGTNRVIVDADSDIDLAPIFTGTHNVFPALMELILGGMVAGLNALGKTADMLESLRPRAKINTKVASYERGRSQTLWACHPLAALSIRFTPKTTRVFG